MGNTAGKPALPVLNRVQGKKAVLVGMHVGATRRKGNTWKGLNLNQRKSAPRVVASKKYGSSVTCVMAREKGLMDCPVAHVVDMEASTKSVPPVAARAVF